MKVEIRSRRNRRGLTLIELVVVLLILAGVAGIVVPVLQNMVLKTHGAAGSANVAEVAKAIQLFEAQRGEHPNDYDSLIDEAGALVNDANANLVSATTTARMVDALGDLNITESVEHLSTSTNLTFAPYDTPTAFQDLTVVGSPIATLSGAGITSLGLRPTGGLANSDPVAYVAFGVGQLNEAIGVTMVDAPVHFPEGGENPIDEYSRFVVVYAIPNSGPARLVSVAAAHEEGLSGLSSHLNEYYSTQN